jgi:hypothetical protein
LRSGSGSATMRLSRPSKSIRTFTGSGFSSASPFFFASFPPLASVFFASFPSPAGFSSSLSGRSGEGRSLARTAQ